MSSRDPGAADGGPVREPGWCRCGHIEPVHRMDAVTPAVLRWAGDQIRAEAARLEERDGAGYSYAYGFADAADFIDPPPAPDLAHHHLRQETTP